MEEDRKEKVRWAMKYSSHFQIDERAFDLI